MIEILIGLFILSVIGNVLLTLRIRVLSFTVKKQNEYNTEMEDFILSVQNHTNETYKRILQIDHMGYFKNNDHTGLVFNGLKNQVEILNKFINEQSDKEFEEKYGEA